MYLISVSYISNKKDIPALIFISPNTGYHNLKSQYIIISLQGRNYITKNGSHTQTATQEEQTSTLTTNQDAKSLLKATDKSDLGVTPHKIFLITKCISK